MFTSIICNIVNWTGLHKGGEYMGLGFYKLMYQKNILHEVTKAYSPESNGSSKRLDITVINLDLSIVLYTFSCVCTLGLKYWILLFSCGTDYSERVASWATVFSKWTMGETSMKNFSFKVFESRTSAHVSRKKQREFDPTATEGILVGHCKTVAWRMWLPEKRQLVKSKHVCSTEKPPPSSKSQNVNDWNRLSLVFFKRMQ